MDCSIAAYLLLSVCSEETGEKEDIEGIQRMIGLLVAIASVSHWVQINPSCKKEKQTKEVAVL